MRMSALFGTTLREAPSDASSPAAALLARAGYLRELGRGAWAWLPLGQRALARLEALVRAETAAMGAQDVTLPLGQDPASAPGLLAALCRTEVRSWRHLPRLLAFSTTDATDFLLLDADLDSLERRSIELNGACVRVLASCGVNAVQLGAAGRQMPTVAFLDDAGDASLLRCPACGETALRETARFARTPAPGAPLPLQRVSTPDCTTIEALCRLLGIEPSRTAKAVFQVADEERFVFAVVRGDRELSAAKLMRTLGAARLRPATPEEIQAAGAAPGYASPIGLPPATLVVADEEVVASANLVAGANEPGFHLMNTNVSRDYRPGVVADIAAAPEGAACASCGTALLACRGISITIAHDAFGAWRAGRQGVAFQDREGREQPVLGAALRFDFGRALLSIAAACRDDRGLCMPRAVSPFAVHVVSLGGKGTDAMESAERLCSELSAAGVPVLFDDREERPGVAFADADLIGVPVRVTVSARSLAAGGVEMKTRDAAERVILPVAEAAARLRALCADGGASGCACQQ